jgi:alkylation response protein AidB-like acyl-CoA dehydrogenase
VLNGEKVVVSNGANADTLIVAARTPVSRAIAMGDQPVHRAGRCGGVERVTYRLMDGQNVANITFKDVASAADALLGELR